MTDALTAELVEGSRRVLDAELSSPIGLEPDPLIQRWHAVQSHLEELGWFDLLGAPATGGLGLSPALAARLLRLAGSHLVPGPVIEAVLTVPWLLAQPDVSAGLLHDHRLAVATVDTCRDLPGNGIRQPLRLHRGRLHGTAQCVVGASSAGVLLVHALDGDAERLVVVPATHPGVQVQLLRGADPCQPVGHVSLDCAVGEEHLICSPDDLLPTRLRAWTRLGSAAYLAGISERVLTFGVDHALVREQFGRRIGSFQAVQHLLADVAVLARSSATLIDVAAEELAGADEHEAALIAVTAKAQAGADAVLACETVLQVLGGIGFTVEHPLHHYFKRALSLAARHGSAAELHLLAGRAVLARSQGA